MTKFDLTRALYNRVGGLSLAEAHELVDLLFETMKETLGRGEKVKISGFGNFVLRDKRERRGRDPQSGVPLVLAARRVLLFKESRVVRGKLNPRPTSEPLAAEE